MKMAIMGLWKGRITSQANDPSDDVTAIISGGGSRRFFAPERALTAQKPRQSIEEAANFADSCGDGGGVVY